MLRITQSNSADRAKSYFTTADYYSEGQELIGLWRGEAARLLGLGGMIRKEQWDRLCENRDPWSTEPLTVRTKEQRRVGYDFTFSVPKSVSLLYGLTKDARVLEAFQDAVGATMHDIETEMHTRVRTGDRDEDRPTGNMVWGEYVHTTGRPVGGVPDPQLHCHCFVFNATWDAHEQRWKAGQFAGVKEDAPYFEAVFLSRLARGLAEKGLPIKRDGREWQLAGLSVSTLRRFSRRTELIEQLARERGITDAEEKAELGASTREAKRSELRLEDLQQEWRSRLTADERDALHKLHNQHVELLPHDQAREANLAVDHAVAHCFERASVVPQRRLAAEAMLRSAGVAAPELVNEHVGKAGLLTGVRDGRRLVTTPGVLAEERRMISFARDGRGTCEQLGPVQHQFTTRRLNAEQKEAVLHLLGSHDRVTLVRGKAGTGKTTMLREAVEAIESTGKRVLALAPSANASRGTLREKGFAGADTLARFLMDEAMQQQTRGQVLLLDEAGQVGTRTMARFLTWLNSCKPESSWLGIATNTERSNAGQHYGSSRPRRALSPPSYATSCVSPQDTKTWYTPFPKGEWLTGFTRWMNSVGSEKLMGSSDISSSPANTRMCGCHYRKASNRS